MSRAAQGRSKPEPMASEKEAAYERAHAAGVTDMVRGIFGAVTVLLYSGAMSRTACAREEAT